MVSIPLLSMAWRALSIMRERLTTTRSCHNRLREPFEVGWGARSSAEGAGVHASDLWRCRNLRTGAAYVTRQDTAERAWVSTWLHEDLKSTPSLDHQSPLARHSAALCADPGNERADSEIHLNSHRASNPSGECAPDRRPD